MATYVELFALLSDTQFAQRIQVGSRIAARDILADGAAKANDKQVARRILASGLSADELNRVLTSVVVDAAVVAAGSAIADTALQTIVTAQVKNLSA